MADFDNGLPPAGTTTDGRATAIAVGKDVYDEAGTAHVDVVVVDKEIYDEDAATLIRVQNVTMGKELYQPAEPVRVEAVAVNKGRTGENYFTMV